MRTVLVRVFAHTPVLLTRAAIGVALTLAVANASSNTTPPLEPAAAARFGRLALSCLHREYPNKIGHVMDSGHWLGTFAVYLTSQAGR